MEPGAAAFKPQRPDQDVEIRAAVAAKPQVSRSLKVAILPHAHWVRVFTGEPPRTALRPGSTFVDVSRISRTSAAEVRFWVLVQHLDAGDELYVAECSIDCATRLTTALRSTVIRGTVAEPLTDEEVHWKDAGLSFQGKAVGRFVCGEGQHRLAVGRATPTRS